MPTRLFHFDFNYFSLFFIPASRFVHFRVRVRVELEGSSDIGRYRARVPVVHEVVNYDQDHHDGHTAT